LDWVLLKRVLRRRYKKWKKQIIILLSFIVLLLFMWFTGIFLYTTSQIQKWSPEVNAAIVNLVASVITSVMMISVTIYFNTKTQKMTVEIQKMNYDAMKFQARATIRDKILEKRMEIYPQIMKELSNLEFDPIIYYKAYKKSYYLTVDPSEKDEEFDSFHDYVEKMHERIDGLWKYYDNPFVSRKLKDLLDEYLAAKWSNFRIGKYDNSKSKPLGKIISVDSYLSKEYKYFDLIMEQIVKELQLKEVERDIENLIQDKDFVNYRLDRMI
jgi:hypothetical protein